MNWVIYFATPLTIWIIGWLFSIGWCMQARNDLSLTFSCAVGGILGWPLFLGMMLHDKLE